MIVEILCGGYGCPTKTGVHTVAHGERCEVSDAEAARLIGLGVAKCAFSAPTAPETAPADVPATAEGNDTPAAEASQNGSEAAHLDPDQLQSMTVAELKKLAADMGIAADSSGASVLSSPGTTSSAQIASTSSQKRTRSTMTVRSIRIFPLS